MHGFIREGDIKRIKNTSLKMKMEETPKPADVKKGISLLWETLQCPICLELMTTPVSTKCDHQFCKYCMMKLLDNSKQNGASCPVCKSRVTRRSLQESPGFQKLVAGLQDMIHAYELDTGTNYFTSMVLPKHRSLDTDVDTQTHSRTSEDPLELGNLKDANNDDVLKDQSSTIKAPNKYAILMGFEDSSPTTTEIEGLDSGLGGPPPPSEQKKTTDILELITTEEQAAVDNTRPAHNTRVLMKSSHLPTLILEEETEVKEMDEAAHDEDEERVAKLSKRKRNSDPDKILKQRQKKSVEKVREWLNTVPNEEDIEVDKSERDAQYLDDSDSLSSASTIDLNQQNYDSFVNEKNGQTKALEDQVFGAVYKREKKRNGKRMLPCDILTKLSSEEENEPVKDEEKNKSNVEKEHELLNLKDDSSEFFKDVEHLDTEVHDESQKQPEPELSDELQNINNEISGKNALPLIQRKSRKLKKNSRKKTKNALEQIDSDLQEQAKIQPQKAETKKMDKTITRQTRLNKVKLGRLSKPLDLVEVPNGEKALSEEQKSKFGSNQAQIHIENYPSSEDQDSALVQSTRRSKRLQSFVEEIKVSKKKRQLKGYKYDSKVIPEEDTFSTSPKCAKINGCIYNDDLGGIEKVGSCENPNILKQMLPLQEVSNVEIPTSGAGRNEPILTKSPISPGEVNTVQESDVHTDTNKTHSELMGCKDEEQEDDSEIDTEQLVKSFKATKRKSFHLEAPNAKRSYSLNERVEQKSGDVQAFEQEKMPHLDTFQSSNSQLSDVIPPSVTQIEKRMEYEEIDVPDKPNTDSLKSSISGALSPNKVTKYDTPSPHVSAVPHVVDSGLRYSVSRLSDGTEPMKQWTKNVRCSHVSETQSAKADENSLSLLDPEIPKNQSTGSLSQSLLNTENSLTPDGLLTRPNMTHVEVVNSHDSGSAQSSIKTHPKRRKSRRLESSPESDSCESQEELPSLAQILKRHSSNDRDDCVQNKGDLSEVKKPLAAEGSRLSHSQCPSPDYVNSSQASVDLFGTPEEPGDVPGNNAGASMELSQFSSEILVTQQKIEMQKELLRLEKLMALVSEVLHEKENVPENEENDTKLNSKLQGGPQPSNEAVQKQRESNGHLRADGNTRAGPSDAKSTPKPNVTKQGTEAAHKDTSPSASKTPAASSSAQGHKNRESPSEDKENNTPPNDQRKPKILLACSGLGPSEQIMVKKFAKTIGSRVVSHVTSDVTHVIMHTDEQLVCERTLKYFLGIAGRKWVVSFQWISECFRQKKLVDESLFEVKGDVVNGHNHEGPMRARTTDDNSLLMKGYKIYLQGPFTDMTTDEMEWMVELCGATAVKDPSVLEGKQTSHQLVIVQSGSDISASKYNSLSRVATVVTRGWLLDSVSVYTMQNCKNYTI